MSSLKIRQFPCLSDNYGFLIHDPDSRETVALDTPDADAYLVEAEAAGWTITQIWNTHHHHDHAGGNAALKAATGATITAPGYDRHRISPVDRYVEDGDTVSLGKHAANVLFTPGHTMGHIVYHFSTEKIAFVGDTLFALGCGRLFEGSAADMWASLSRLRQWPDDTRLYCAHEYTQANAAFALSVDPANAALNAYADEVSFLRAQNKPTVPTTMAREKVANPFLRADSADLAKQVGLSDADPVAVFAEIRARKDRF
jgi:hydroxyacylglutathione hydrolase